MTYFREEDEEDDVVEGNSNVKVIMSKKLKNKLDYLSTDYTKSEICGFITKKNLEEKDGEVTLVLDDLLIPPQEAKSSEVDIDGLGQIALYQEYGSEVCQRIIGHWHSHHTMGSFFSSTDEEMMKSYSENKTFCLFIVSSKGHHLIRMVLKNKPFELKIDNVEYEVEADDSIAKEMEDEIKKKVKEPVITTTTTITSHSNSSEVKQVKKDIESRVKYYQHRNHMVKIERIYKYYADLIEKEFKILNPVISASTQESGHYDVVVELGDKNKAKEFMVDVKELLIKTIMLEREKIEAQKDDDKYWENYRRETSSTTLKGQELQDYLDELEEEEYMSELEREEALELAEGNEARGFSGRCDWNNFRDREQKRLMNRDFNRYDSGYIDYTHY